VLLGLTTMLAVHSDNILALSLLGPEAAGQMAVAQRACMTALGLLWVLTQPLWPAFTDAAVRGDDRWLRTHIVRAAVLVTACAVGGAALLVAFGQQLMELWLGGGLAVDQGVFWAMAAWIVVPALGRIPDVLLNALGVVWFQVGVALVYAAFAFVLKLTLAPRLGIAGILLATGISYGCTHLPAYLWWVWRWMRGRTRRFSH
jgi:O-antigen/teichoic acid export membrane protein